MSDIILRSTTRTQVQIRTLTNALKQLPQRLREQDGQDTIEYIGVLLVVAAVIGIVLAVIPGLEGTIQTGATNLINDVFGAKATGTH